MIMNFSELTDNEKNDVIELLLYKLNLQIVKRKFDYHEEDESLIQLEKIPEF